MGINSKKTQDFIQIRYNLMKNMNNNEGANKVNPKPRVKLSQGPI
jgi:hypothetical protein